MKVYTWKCRWDDSAVNQSTKEPKLDYPTEALDFGFWRTKRVSKISSKYASPSTRHVITWPPTTLTQRPGNPARLVVTWYYTKYYTCVISTSYKTLYNIYWYQTFNTCVPSSTCTDGISLTPDRGMTLRHAWPHCLQTRVTGKEKDWRQMM